MIKIKRYELFIVASVLLLIIVIILVWIVVKRINALPYRKANSLLTNAEKNFFKILLDMNLGDNIYIFSKVRVADVIYLPDNTKNRNTYLRKILSKHIDFLICSRDNFIPLLAIELDDRSHSIKENRKRDIEKNKILSSANIPLLRVQNRRNYDIYGLQKDIAKYLK